MHAYTRDFISRCVADQDAWSTLRSLCETVGTRLAGSPEELAATQLVTEQFERAGLEVSTEPFSFTGWTAGESRVVLHEPRGPSVLPSRPLGWSPGAAVRAAVADVGRGLDDDFRRIAVRGRIALVSSENPPDRKDVHRSHKYAWAEEAGAAGFLFYDPRPGGLVGMGSARLEVRPGTIPAAGISYEDAMRLRTAAGAADVELSCTSTFGPTQSHNGIGLKRGESGEEILVGGHVDSWFSQGAVDNGTGVTAVMELARLLAPYRLRRSVRFVSFGSEELGLLGSRAYVEAHPDLSRVALVVNLDCPALAGGRLSVMSNAIPALHGFLQEVAGSLHLDVDVTDEVSRFSDHVPFRSRGVPGVHLISHAAGAGFGHSEYDSLDKVRPQDFTVPLLVAGAAIIECAMGDARFPIPA